MCSSKEPHPSHRKVNVQSHTAMSPVLYLLPFPVMGITTTSAMSSNIVDRVLFLATVLLDRWQHHSWFQNGRDWRTIETMASDKNFGLLKARNRLAYTNVCPKCVTQILWMWVLLDDEQDWFKKVKQQEQHFTTNSLVVALALQLCLTTSAGLMTWQAESVA